MKYAGSFDFSFAEFDFGRVASDNVQVAVDQVALEVLVEHEAVVVQHRFHLLGSWFGSRLADFQLGTAGMQLFEDGFVEVSVALLFVIFGGVGDFDDSLGFEGWLDGIGDEVHLGQVLDDGVGAVVPLDGDLVELEFGDVADESDLPGDLLGNN